jgi:hypothetical protein
MTRAAATERDGGDNWEKLSEFHRQRLIAQQKAALRALGNAEIPDAATHAGRPFGGGEDAAEGSFRAIARHIAEG